MNYLALFISLPTKASSGRMRVWRSLKSLGCAALRDGVYLLPDTPENAENLEKVAAEARDAQGDADIYRLAGYEDGQLLALKALFDRSADPQLRADGPDRFLPRRNATADLGLAR